MIDASVPVVLIEQNEQVIEFAHQTLEVALDGVVMVGVTDNKIEEFNRSLHWHISEIKTVETDGQSLFVLNQLPKPDEAVDLTINGIAYRYGIDFSVTGTTLSWLATANNHGFDLTTADEVLVSYQTTQPTP